MIADEEELSANINPDHEEGTCSTPPEGDLSTNVVDDTSASHLSQYLIIFLLALQAHYHLSGKVLSLLLTFFRAFLRILGQFSTVCARIAEGIPSSVHKLWKLKGACVQSVQRFVVCRKCYQTYGFQDCIEICGTLRSSKKCSYQRFPNHPHVRGRAQCGSTLLKTVELISGRKVLYPFLMYCYLGLENSIQPLLMSASFVNACEQWRTRHVPDGEYKDVYDGSIWNAFMEYNNSPFLSVPLTYGVIMNIDWFQPYKHVRYSVGVIYLVVMNLPRSVRYKVENVMLIGIIPGPHEPPQDINSFLKPLVDELLLFLNGTELNVAGSSTKKKVRCALLSVACDLPAGRKVCGFLSYNAQLGCSKCLKKFTGSVGALDYSGFDRQNWPVRTNLQHRQKSENLLRCTTKTELQQRESESGCRYSVLLKLPYFDAPQMLIVDPMHNLFLGSAKHYIRDIWLDCNIINTTHFSVIQSRVNSAVVPTGIGRIPHKIMSGFSSLTADQLKNWVIYFSILSLRGILTGDNLECWRHFVLACRILCSRQLTKEKILLADALLLQFCRRTQRLYGPKSITPNMHMHCHLRECIFAYGPLHGFWLFSFERYNGLLGELPHNNRSIEQLMNRFIRDNSSLQVSLPDEFKEELGPLIPQAKRSVGSLLDSARPDISPDSSGWCIEIGHQYSTDLPSHFSRGVFNLHEIEGLKELYSRLYSVSVSDVDIPLCYRKYRTVKLNQIQIGSHNSQSSHSSLVLVYWNQELFGLPCLSGGHTAYEERPARINYFAYHSISIQSHQHNILLFSASFFKAHPSRHVWQTCHCLGV